MKVVLLIIEIFGIAFAILLFIRMLKRRRSFNEEMIKMERQREKNMVELNQLMRFIKQGKTDDIWRSRFKV